jgi:hypothetical protein
MREKHYVSICRLVVVSHKGVTVPRGGIVEINVFNHLAFPNFIKAHTDCHSLFQKIPKLATGIPVRAEFRIRAQKETTGNRADSVEMGHEQTLHLPEWLPTTIFAIKALSF